MNLSNPTISRLLYLFNKQTPCCVRPFSNRSQMTSNISGTFACSSCVSPLFLPHFDVICDLDARQLDLFFK